MEEGEKSCSEFEIKNLDRGLSLKEQFFEKKVNFTFKFQKLILIQEKPTNDFLIFFEEGSSLKN